jgi:sulfate permease, SulP family
MRDPPPMTAAPHPATQQDTSALRWLREYNRRWLRADVIAGLTLAAYLIPAGIGDASLANLPPQAGLYACLFAGLVFWTLCSSRHTVITVTSAISLLVGVTLAGHADGDPQRFAALAAATALLVALIALVASIFRAGAIVDFISEPVLVGFKCGVALFLISSQLPKLCGLKAPHGSFWERSGYLLSHLDEAHVPSLLIGGAALLVLVLGKVLLRHKPVALFVIAAAIALASFVNLEEVGVRLLGPVPHGLPVPRLPPIQWTDLNDLLPLAMACFLLGAVETAAIGRMFAAKHGGRINANRDFLALAVANTAAGLGGGYAVSGGMSQSAVNESAGAKTPLSGLIAAIVILIVVLFLAKLLQVLPQPVVAAVVLVAVTGLFRPHALLQLWRLDRPEFVAAMGTLVGVLGSGLLRGVLIGAVISLVQLIRRASRPHVAVLGRIPDTRRYSDLARHPDNESIPGLLLLRPEASLVYFNIGHVCDAIRDHYRAHQQATRAVVIDLSASPYMDLQSAEALAQLAIEFTATGVEVHAVEARATVRDRLRATGAAASLGGIDRSDTVADTVDRLAAPAALPVSG